VGGGGVSSSRLVVEMIVAMFFSGCISLSALNRSDTFFSEDETCAAKETSTASRNTNEILST
jgi:hypothetical protein